MTTVSQLHPATSASRSSEQRSLSDIARECLVSTEGDVDSAIEHVLDILDGDAVLRRSIVSEAVDFAARENVQAAHRHGRQRIWAAAGAKIGVVDLARGISNALLDFPLAGGLKLRDATRDEVLKQAQLYRVSAADMGVKARWLSEIGRRCPAGKRVGDVFSEAKIADLKAEAAK